MDSEHRRLSPRNMKTTSIPAQSAKEQRWVGPSGLVTTRQRSDLMSRVKGTGNLTTEVKLAKLLRSSAISGWRRHHQIPGKPDFCFRSYKVAIFVDGCFWHGCPKCYVAPKRNADFWRSKVAANQARDGRTDLVLEKKGWNVIRIWECQIRKEPVRAISRIQKAISSQSG